MSNSPLVSVIIPIYNASDYLQRCLVSILNQSYKNIEIILINDGSTDNSVEICKKWEKDNNNIIFIDSLNKGVSEARNKGLEISKGDYICFIDSDDYIDKNYIKILLQTALYENADIVECNYKRVLENGNLIEKKDLKEYCKTNTYDIIHDFLYGLQFSNTVWNKIFKKDILNNVKFKPYATSEDFNFLAHVYLNVKKKVNVNKYLYYYVNHKSSVCNKDFSKKTLDVIYAREDVFFSYKYMNYNYYCQVIASRIIFFTINFYEKTNSLSSYEKDEIRKELKKIYKKYYKIALQLKVRVDGRKINLKQKIIDFITIYSFFINPFLTINFVNLINKKRNR